VRGNGKIIQELESEFRGSGWNVIKLVWGTHWDALFNRDKKGILKKRMMELVDGEYQTFKAKNGAYVREHFFNTPALRELIADWTDDDVWQLNRGGHDIFKIFAAYNAAVTHKGAPTLILAKTIKGFGMGQAGEAMNISHQQKKMDKEQIARFRDRFGLPVPDDKLEELPYLTFAPDSAEYKYMQERRAALGGYLPQRRRKAEPLAGSSARQFRRTAQGIGRRSRVVDDDGHRAHHEHAAEGQECRQERRPDRAGRIPHLRHGRHVPLGRHLESARPELCAGRPRPADVLQGIDHRSGAAGRHQRSRRDERLDCRWHRLQRA
jgi:pyruvate dehydrogenase complex dehydrogenase (E1) component